MPLRFLLLVGVLGGLVSQAQSADNLFTRVTTGPGGVPNGSSAAAWGDFNQDGWLDLFITSFGGTQNNYCYTNNGDGTFTRVLSTFFPANNINSFGCAWADYDNDGRLDLVKGIFNAFGGSTQLYRNNGNGTFSNVTAASVGTVGPGANNVIWGDYDNDGHIDLFLAVSYNAPENVLLHNRGDGTFSRVTGSPVVTATGLSGGASWGDYDNDGRLDLLVTRGSAGCLFYHNEGGGLFRPITNQLFNTETNGGGVSWGDYDNDGFLDVFVAHAQAPNRLYHNQGDGTFNLLTNHVIYLTRGASTGGAWADYDNDGWLDLFVANTGGNGSFLFHNDGDGAFTRMIDGPVSTDIGTGQGAAWGDFDNNGFQDLFVPNIFTYTNFLYRNHGNANAWLTLQLEGRLSNRAAIGAKVRAKATIGGRELWQLREISGGGSLGSQNDLRVGFGLGDASKVDLVRIEWPSGMVQELHDVLPRQFLTLIEPDAGITPPLQSVPMGETAVFTVSTTLAPPLSFQWRHQGADLAGETNATLVITNTQAQHAGPYTVTVRQPDTGLIFGSTAAQLTGPVIITEPPRSVNVRPGSNTLFQVALTGSSPMTYRWRFEGSDLPNATNATWLVTNAQVSLAGHYDVVVANSYGAVTSSPAMLGLLINPVITIQPLSQSVVSGGEVTLSVAVTGTPAPFRFEWRRGSTILWTNITSEPMSFFTLTNVQTNLAGNYRVVIKNLANPSGLASSNALLTIQTDSDHDGLPDDWEIAQSLNPANPSDAALDADADGITNLREYQAGTNPQDPLSFLQIDGIDWSPTGASLRLTAVSNKTYSVQSTPAIPGVPWTRLADVPAASSNRTILISDPGTTGPRFYRLATPRAP